MTAFEDFVNLELPRRSAFLTYEITSYDGDPNSGSAPAALQGAPKGTWFLQQTGSIYWRKRTSASDSWVISNIDATYEEMDIYVRAADGDDGNSGTSSSPLETLIEAEARIPYYVNHVVRIHVGPHDGNGYAVPEFRGLSLSANVYLIGDGGGGGTDGFIEIIASASAQSGSSDEVVVTTGGLGTTKYNGYGDLWGATIEILTGAAAGDRKTIRNNTATEIYPNSKFSAAVSAGDTYRIIKPETTIYYNTTDYNKVIVDGCGASLNDVAIPAIPNRVWFVNLRFTKGTSQGYWDFVASNSGIVFMGVVFTEEVQFKLANCSLNSGMTRYRQTPDDVVTDLVVTDLGVPNEKSWNGWGTIVESETPEQATIYLRGSDDSVLNGSFNAEQFGNTNGISHIYFGSLWGGSYAVAQVSRRSKMYIYPIDMDILWGSLTESGLGIDVDGNLELLARGGTDRRFFLYSSGDSISCRGQGFAVIISISNGVNLQSDTGIGLVTTEGIIKSVAEVPIITAGGGDFSQDAGRTIHTISELVSGSRFASLGYGSISKV